MRDPARIPVVMKQLQELWEIVPDWRLTQLIENVYRFSNANRSFWSVEDNVMLDTIQGMKERFGNDGGTKETKE